MHIVLGIIGAIVTILILLNRLADAGVDLGGLNPVLWHRRRQWRQRYQGNPIFAMDKPMEVTALLMAAMAKADGDITTEQKQLVLSLFEEEFHLSRRDAAGLLTMSTHLLGDGREVREKASQVLAPSRANFTPEQAESALSLLQRVANCEGEPSELQREFMQTLETELRPHLEPAPKWA
jgi:uncharacterized tellurite resistance protein B-like protein